MPPKSKTPPSRGGGSRRSAPTKVSKPFPWGTVLGSIVLAVALIGVLTYAALNQGSGVDGVIAAPDENIEGVVVADDLDKASRDHVSGAVKYPQNPPNAGAHNAVPQTCAVYGAPIAPEHALHSLEHGAVWITYNSDTVSADDVQKLRDEADGETYLLMSPIANQTSPINLSSWGRRLSVESAGDERVGQFITAYANGPQTPERGASCVGTSATGPVQAAPAAPAPAPSGPAGRPSTAASPATS